MKRHLWKTTGIRALSFTTAMCVLATPAFAIKELDISKGNIELTEHGYYQYTGNKDDSQLHDYDSDKTVKITGTSSEYNVVIDVKEEIPAKTIETPPADGEASGQDSGDGVAPANEVDVGMMAEEEISTDPPADESQDTEEEKVEDETQEHEEVQQEEPVEEEVEEEVGEKPQEQKEEEVQQEEPVEQVDEEQVDEEQVDEETQEQEAPVEEEVEEEVAEKPSEVEEEDEEEVEEEVVEEEAAEEEVAQDPVPEQADTDIMLASETVSETEDETEEEEEEEVSLLSEVKETVESFITVIFENLSITDSDQTDDKYAVDVKNDSKVTIQVSGDNNNINGNIRFSGGTLTITDDGNKDTNDKLTVKTTSTDDAAIGSNGKASDDYYHMADTNLTGTLNITGEVNVEAESTGSGAGIGTSGNDLWGGRNGVINNITGAINITSGGTVSGKSSSGAGIGTGKGGDIGTYSTPGAVNISGSGTVTGESSSGTGIGATGSLRNGAVTIDTTGTVIGTSGSSSSKTASTRPGIGGWIVEGDAEIDITAGESGKVTGTSYGKGAGIGSGADSTTTLLTGDINITADGGTVTGQSIAVGRPTYNKSGAGIGMGAYNSNESGEYAKLTGTISVTANSDGVVNAIGGTYGGAGIGTGYKGNIATWQSIYGLLTGKIKIGGNGGTVNATGGSYTTTQGVLTNFGSGVGTGFDGSILEGTSITVQDSVTLNATGGVNAADIGTANTANNGKISILDKAKVWLKGNLTSIGSGKATKDYGTSWTKVTDGESASYELSCGATINGTKATDESVKTTYLASMADSATPEIKHNAVAIADVAATCTTDGQTGGTECSICGEQLSAPTTVAATGHTAVVDEAVAPTCTSAGLTQGNHCSVCGETLTAQETIPATGHTAVEVEAAEPTCTAAGHTAGTVCSVCGEVLTAQETIPATGHTVVVDEAVAPTYTSTGLTQGSHCSVCGEVLVAQEVIPALTAEPAPAEPTVEPTVETDDSGDDEAAAPAETENVQGVFELNTVDTVASAADGEAVKTEITAVAGASGQTVETAAAETTVEVQTLSGETKEVEVAALQVVIVTADHAEAEQHTEVANALAAAEASGSTVEAMAQSSTETAAALAEAGASASVSQTFYLGVRDDAANYYTAQTKAVVNMPSDSDAERVTVVLYYDEAAAKWVSVPFEVVNGNKIIIRSANTGVYRFVSRAV